MPFLALTLKLDATAAEAMSEALIEAGAQSVSLEGVDDPQRTVQALLAPCDDPDAIVRAAAQAAGLPAAPVFSTSSVADQDWVRSTQAQFEAIEIGERLWVGPSWREPPPGRAAVRIDPGLAFGTGSHPTTRLVLGLLERTIRGGERVLDYGCGSGILALAAAKLGAARVDALDVDPQAVETAAANARANGVELRAALPEGLPPALYDIVVSNILAQPLILLAPVLAARTARGGRLALAGILESQGAEVATAYQPWFDAELAERCEGWVLVTGVRR
jgi:ribosomal protein L11 methyltransferase